MVITAEETKRVLRKDANVAPRRFRPRLAIGQQQELLALAAELEGKDPEFQQARLSEAILAVDSERTRLLVIGLSEVELKPLVAFDAALCILPATCCFRAGSSGSMQTASFSSRRLWPEVRRMTWPG